MLEPRRVVGSVVGSSGSLRDEWLRGGAFGRRADPVAGTAQDAEVGDPRFDRVFVVESTEDDEARAVLAEPSVQRELVACSALEPSLGFVRGHAHAERSGPVQRPDELRAMLEAVTRAAAALEHAPQRRGSAARRWAGNEGLRWVLERQEGMGRVAAILVVGAVAVILGAPLVGFPAWTVLVGLGRVVALAMVAVPQRPELRLEAHRLGLTTRRQSVEVPLAEAQVWGARRQVLGITASTVLFVRAGERCLRLGATGHAFDDPRWYQTEIEAEPDAYLSRHELAELLNQLMYRLRRRGR